MLLPPKETITFWISSGNSLYSSLLSISIKLSFIEYALLKQSSKIKTIPSASSLTASAVTLSPFFKANENLSPTSYFLLFLFVLSLRRISIVTFIDSSIFRLQPIEKLFVFSSRLQKSFSGAAVGISLYKSLLPIIISPSNDNKNSTCPVGAKNISPRSSLNNFIVHSPLFMFDYSLFLRCGRVYPPCTDQIYLTKWKLII